MQIAAIRTHGNSADRIRGLASTLVVATGALFGSATPAQESRARTDVQWIQAVRQALCA